MTTTKLKKRIRLKGFNYKGCHRYALTLCTNNKSPYFNDINIVRKIMGFLQDEAKKQRFKIWSCCFMPDHLHILIEGESFLSDMKSFVSIFKQKSGFWFSQMQKEPATLKGCPTKDNEGNAVVQGFKNDSVGQGFSLAKNSAGNVRNLWQVNYHEHILRSDEATEKFAQYILDNPVRKGLVKDFRDYPFSWCDIFGIVGQGFKNDSVGQGFSLAKRSNSKGLPYNNQKGFTLIELIMVIVLISIIAGIAAMIILEGAKSYQKEVSYSDIHNQGRLAIERMAREIRMSRQASEIGTAVLGTITGNPTNSLIFTDVSGTTITYSLSGTTLNRTVSGTPSPLANNVNTLEFRHYDNAGNPTTVAANVWLIEIYLITSNAGETLPLRLRVHPRNF